LNILLEGMFYNGHGFAEGNRILLRILDQAGYRVRILAKDSADKYLVLNRREIQYISAFERTKLTSNDIFICNWVGSNIRYNPEFRINIARTTFETDRIPSNWVPVLNQFKEVWVQSTFNLRTFEKSGVHVPLRLIPNFFDVSTYTPHGKKMPLPATNKYLFLSIFDLQDRKGYEILLKAYLNEFSHQDNVALIIKIRDSLGNYKLERLIEAHGKSAKEKPPIYMIDQMLSVPELHSLYRACDAFVLPTRGEGWGRPFFEAMLMGMPTIATDWSGQTDFMNKHNSYLIKVKRLVHITNNELPMFNGHYWAEPSLKDLQKKMRYVYEHQAEGRQTGRKARNELLRNYKWHEVANRVVTEINKYRKKVENR
jgi:glycosyltransferase involved in cell wall biosynthesis